MITNGICKLDSLIRPELGRKGKKKKRHKRGPDIFRPIDRLINIKHIAQMHKRLSELERVEEEDNRIEEEVQEEKRKKKTNEFLTVERRKAEVGGEYVTKM